VGMQTRLTVSFFSFFFFFQPSGSVFIEASN
jgi:hypothetical protein